MKLAFTICSNNFLAYALSMADSVKEFNPEYEVVIGLADRRSPLIDYSRLKHSIVAIDEIDIPNISWMTANYNIVELNTAVKPFYFEFLFSKYSAEFILFLDPDIRIYNSLQVVTDQFQENDVLLTPHVVNPIPEGVYPWENHFLKHGLYNLGFIGIKNTANAKSLIKWWQGRCAEHCFADAQKGLYVDQLWGNLIPLFFDKVKIDKNPGLNVAFWNLHERQLEYSNGNYLAKGAPLIFFHFSSFSPNTPDLLTKQSFTNLEYQNNDHLRGLMNDYSVALLANNHYHFSGQLFAFAKAHDEEIRKLKIEIHRKEQLLDFLRFRFINKEKLLLFIYSLFRDYMDYNNLVINNKNAYQHNNLDYSFRERSKVAAIKEVRPAGAWRSMRLLISSIKSFLS